MQIWLEGFKIQTTGAKPFSISTVRLLQNQDKETDLKVPEFPFL